MLIEVAIIAQVLTFAKHPRSIDAILIYGIVVGPCTTFVASKQHKERGKFGQCQTNYLPQSVSPRTFGPEATTSGSAWI